MKFISCFRCYVLDGILTTVLSASWAPTPARLQRKFKSHSNILFCRYYRTFAHRVTKLNQILYATAISVRGCIFCEVKRSDSYILMLSTLFKSYGSLVVKHIVFNSPTTCSITLSNHLSSPTVFSECCSALPGILYISFTGTFKFRN